jgi:sodium-dependent phosphate cotransporter
VKIDGNNQDQPSPWLQRRLLLRIAAIGVAVTLFLFSIQLLSAATGKLSPTLRLLLESIVDGNFPALGVSWVTTYGLLNGSAVAATALSLFATELISASQLFLMVVGSRLGSAGVVVLIGGFDFLQKKQYSLREATSLGLLTFIVTHTIYIPAAVLGMIVINVFQFDVVGLSRIVEVNLRWFEFFAPIASIVIERVGAAVGLLLAFLLVVSSLRLFDRVFSTIDTAKHYDTIFTRIEHRLFSLVLGLIITGVSTSVAFSLGVVVPLYNRGTVERKEVIPYIMGASIGTLTDTLFVAIALQSGVGLVMVLLLFGTGTVMTILALAVYGPYLRFVEALHDRLVTDVRAFLLGMGLLILVPVAFVLMPW